MFGAYRPDKYCPTSGDGAAAVFGGANNSDSFVKTLPLVPLIRDFDVIVVDVPCETGACCDKGERGKVGKDVFGGAGICEFLVKRLVVAVGGMSDNGETGTSEIGARPGLPESDGEA